MSDAFTIRGTGASFMLFEAMVRASLLTANKHGPFSLHRDPNGLRQGDLKLRSRAYHSARDGGRMTPTDERWPDSQGHIDRHSEYLTPLNIPGKNEVKTDE